MFINKETGKPYTTIMKVWTRLRTRPAYPTFACMTCGTPTRASWSTAAGRCTKCSRSLGTSDSKVTERYAHLSSKTLQEAANTASVIIQGAGSKAA